MAVQVRVSPKNTKLSELVGRLLECPPEGIESAGLEALAADRDSGAYSLPSLELISKYLGTKQGAGEGKKQEQLSDYLVNPTAPSSLLFPNAPKAASEPSAELLKRREYLKLKAEAREYNRMIYGKEEDPRVAEILEAGNHFSSAKNQLAISANMVVSVVASFAIAYYAGKSFKASATTCLVCGLLGAIAILFIEMSLFIVRAMRYETSSSTDARKLRSEAAQKSGGLAPAAVYEPEKNAVAKKAD